MRKKVLFNTEASYLCTGYASYGREVIRRLVESDKYDVAEFSCYGAADDVRRKEIPWKNYPVAPAKSDNEDIHNFYKANPANQFGAWRFERACLDFKPDVWIGQKDPWMESWVRHSPYRPYFSWAWAATVDSEPQNPEWVDQFASTDYFYTLSEWAETVVKHQGGDAINFMDSVTSCAADEFRPVPNKFAHKISMGINPEWNIIGVVMRNQRRKLFPELFESFARYVSEANDKNTYLYCHTSYPDNGWDLPQLMMKYGISSRVLFTYSCEACHNLTIGKFSDALQQCKSCRKYASKPSSVGNGVTTAELAKIYNTFDIFAQYANSEGQGLGQLEAAACGVPIMSVDFSAMSSIVRKLNGFPIPVKHLNLELETGCYRAIPCIDSTVRYWKGFFSLSEEERESLSKSTLEAYRASYDWDSVVASWMRSIDDCPVADWSKPIRQIKLPKEDTIPNFTNNKDLLDWGIRTYLPYSDLLNSYEANCLLRDLNFKTHKDNPCGFFYSENSYFDRTERKSFSKEDLIRMFRNKAEIFNFWEKARHGYVEFKQESWLND